MQSETKGFIAEIEKRETPQKTLRSFVLYEEYSHVEMARTITKRRGDYEKADVDQRRRLEEQAQKEVDGFCEWLEQTQNMEHERAHYYAISLKSILLGLPIGVQIAELFGDILDPNGSRASYQSPVETVH